MIECLTRKESIICVRADRKIRPSRSPLCQLSTSLVIANMHHPEGFYYPTLSLMIYILTMNAYLHVTILIHVQYINGWNCTIWSFFYLLKNIPEFYSIALAYVLLILVMYFGVSLYFKLSKRGYYKNSS